MGRGLIRADEAWACWSVLSAGLWSLLGSGANSFTGLLTTDDDFGITVYTAGTDQETGCHESARTTDIDG